MNGGALFWVVIFVIATACFFTIAAIVAVKGFHDLKYLLRESKHRPANPQTRANKST